MKEKIEKLAFIVSGTLTGIIATVIFLSKITVAHPIRYELLFIIIGTIIGWVRDENNDERRILHLILGFVFMYPFAYIIAYITIGVLWIARGILRI